MSPFDVYNQQDNVACGKLKDSAKMILHSSYPRFWKYPNWDFEPFRI